MTREHWDAIFAPMKGFTYPTSECAATVALNEAKDLWMELIEHGAAGFDEWGCSESPSLSDVLRMWEYATSDAHGVA